MNDELRELGITPDHDMEEAPEVDGEVSTGIVGENEPDEDDDEKLTLEEEEKLKQADAADYEEET